MCRFEEWTLIMSLWMPTPPFGVVNHCDALCAAVCIAMANRSGLQAQSLIAGCCLLALHQRGWMGGAYGSKQPK